MTQNEVMKDTADAIREKTGKSELIAPVNFAEEIKGITAGGESGGGSNWRYFDVTSYSESQKGAVWSQFAMIASVGGELANMLGVSKVFGGAGFAFQFTKDVVAVAYDANATVGAEGMFMTMQQQIESCPYWADMVGNEITKEQFYSVE